MTAGREKRLMTTQRKMVIKIVGVQRRRRTAATRTGGTEGAACQSNASSVSSSTGNTGSTGSSTSSSSSDVGDSVDDKEGAEEDDDDDEEEDAESWTEWIKRATNIAAGAAKNAGVVDRVEEQRRRKWQWAGHISRRDDGRWTKRLVDWEPFGGRRSWGRPILRWEDTLCQFMKSKGESWQHAAKDRIKWSSREEEFVAKRW
jgi:hypothetical protein